MQALDVRFDERVLAVLDDAVLDVVADLFGQLFDTCRVDSAVVQELLQGLACDCSTDGVEAGNDHDAGRIVDDDVDTGRRFEGTDVAALSADDPALHVITRDGDRGHRVVRAMFGCVSLDRLQRDLQGVVLGLFLGLVGDLLDQLACLVLDLGLDHLQGLALGILLAHVGDAEQCVLLLGTEFFQRGSAIGDDLIQLFFLALDRLLTLLDLGFEVGGVLFLEGQHVELAIEVVLALREPALFLGQLVT